MKFLTEAVRCLQALLIPLDLHTLLPLKIPPAECKTIQPAVAQQCMLWFQWIFSCLYSLWFLNLCLLTHHKNIFFLLVEVIFCLFLLSVQIWNHAATWHHVQRGKGGTAVLTAAPGPSDFTQVGTSESSKGRGLCVHCLFLLSSSWKRKKHSQQNRSCSISLSGACCFSRLKQSPVLLCILASPLHS